ncbi:MAG: LysM peptidoglycan-binding domain-containing protein [Chloroflexota bacterium]|nr:LysM peptidoglycan-binding domain-containing protein [Chloroflexota bacterium]
MNKVNDPLEKFNNNTDETCPYLGLARDRETKYGYPDLENYCHRVKSPQPVSYDHQEKVCFTAEYSLCPVYCSEGQKSFPVELRGEGLPSRLERGFSWGWGVLAIVGIAVIVAVLSFNGHFSPSPSLTPFVVTGTPLITDEDVVEKTAVVFASATPIPVITLTPRISPTPTISLTPTITPTTTPTLGPALGTPFGREEQYLLYRVGAGDSLGNLAYEYDTGEEAIRVASNLREGKSIWPGDLLVIPIGQSDASQVPRFNPLYLDRKTDIYELANRYDISASDIRRYNDLGNDDTIPAGRWMIIPVSGE